MRGRWDGKAAKKENLHKGYSVRPSRRHRKGGVLSPTCEKKPCITRRCSTNEMNTPVDSESAKTRLVADGHTAPAARIVPQSKMIMLAPAESTRRGVDPVRPRCNMTAQQGAAVCW